MTIAFKQACPLCSARAVPDVVPGEGGNMLHYECPMCGDYRISRGAASKASTALAGKREEMARLARMAPEGKILVITLAAPGDPKLFEIAYANRAPAAP